MAVNPYDGAGYGCGIGYGYCGTPASGALDIRAAVGTSTSKTSSEVSTDGHGLKSITGVGFQPKLLLPFGFGITADGPTTQARLAIGAGVSSTSRANVAVSSVNGVTTSDTDRSHTNAKIHEAISESGAYLSADLDSFDTDGFTLDWSTVQSTARILNHIALGGSDLEVSLTQHQMNATNADESFAHGLSGAPTGVLLFTTHDSVSPPNTNVHANIGIGMWSQSGQYAANVYSQSARTTTLCNRVLINNGVLVNNSKTRLMAVGSVDATNVNVTYPITTISQVSYFWMLAIRGAKCQVGTFDCNGSTDPMSIACAGITPVAMRLINVPTGVDSINTLQFNAHLGIGWSDGRNNVSCGITDENGRISGTNARRFQDSDDIVQYDVAGTEKFRARVTFSGESAIITPTVCTDGWDQGAYIIIGK